MMSELEPYQRRRKGVKVSKCEQMLWRRSHLYHYHPQASYPFWDGLVTRLT
jgi:hypothetical protein